MSSFDPSNGRGYADQLTVSTNPATGDSLFNLFSTQTSLGTGSGSSEAQRIYGVLGTYNGITAAGYYVNDLYFGKDAPTDDFIVSTTNTASPTELFRVFINGNGVKTPGAYYNANGIVIPSTAGGNTGISTGKVSLVPGTEAFGFNTLTSGTVTVNNAAACTPSATCVYKLTNCAKNSSTGIGTLSVGTISAGTSFVINSLGPTASVLTTDASSVCWQIN
jgi:hypothetical protein